MGSPLQYSWASLESQLVKKLTAMRETWTWSLDWEIPWRRERLPTPVCWPREFHGLYSPWGCKELDMTEWLLLLLFHSAYTLNRWGNNRNSERLYFWGGSKITADGVYSHEIKRHFLLGRKGMTYLDCILKSRDIMLLRKVHLVKGMIFPVLVYGCKSWTIQKAEHQRRNAFELWCWTRLLRVPWTAKRSNQSILKEISPEYSLEGLMLKLKLKYFGHLMWRTDSLEKTLILGKIDCRSRRGWQRMRLLDGITDSMDMKVWASSSSWWRKRKTVMLQSMGFQTVRYNWATEMNW